MVGHVLKVVTGLLLSEIGVVKLGQTLFKSLFRFKEVL